jgi:hypothetical protein
LAYFFRLYKPFIDFNKNGFVYILGDFFSKSSGQSVVGQQEEDLSLDRVRDGFRKDGGQLRGHPDLGLVLEQDLDARIVHVLQIQEPVDDPGDNLRGKNWTKGLANAFI